MHITSPSVSFSHLEELIFKKIGKGYNSFARTK